MEKPPEFEEVKRQWQCNLISARAAARKLKISHYTFKKWIDQEKPPEKVHFPYRRTCISSTYVLQ